MPLIESTKRFVRYLVFAPALVLLALGCEKNENAPDKYLYRGQETGRVVTFDLARNSLDNGHRTVSVGWCKKSAFRVCIEGEFVLAIPSGTLSTGDVWQHGGYKFSVVSADENSAKPNYKILAQPPSGPKMYLFFNKDGIWGMQLVEDGELFKAEDNCGLGCSRSQG